MTTTPTEDARIRELLLVNLFAVFSEFDPEHRMNAIVANYTKDVIWSSPEATTRVPRGVKPGRPTAARPDA